MQQHYIRFLKSQISYYRFGGGSRTVFAFHGYSNDSHVFDVLEECITGGYTFIAIDLPVHGDTRWRNGLLSPQKMQSIINLIIQTENLPEEYWLLGFSLGGRIAMSLFQQFPEHIKTLILLAPDGLYKERWYKFIAQSYIGTRMISYFLKRPQQALSVLNRCRKYRIVNRNLYVYIQGLLNSKRQSTLLYARWIIMRKMRPNLNKLCKQIKKNETKVKLIFGAGDTITPEHNAQYLVANAAPYTDFQEWESGHLLLRKKYYNQLVSLFDRF